MESAEFVQHSQKSALDRGWQIARIALKRNLRHVRNALLAMLAHGSITANQAHGNIELSLWNPQLKARESGEIDPVNPHQELWNDFLKRTDSQFDNKSTVLSLEAISMLEGEELPLEELWKNGEHLVIRLADLFSPPHPEVEQRWRQEDPAPGIEIMDKVINGLSKPTLSLRSGKAVIHNQWRQDMLGGTLRISTNMQLEPDMSPLENLRLRVVFTKRWAEDLVRILAEAKWNEEKGAGLALGASWEHFLSEQASLRISVDSNGTTNHQVSIGFSIDWGGSSNSNRNVSTTNRPGGRRRSWPEYLAGKAVKAGGRWEQK